MRERLVRAARRHRKKLTALLDAQSGVEFEGETKPLPAADEAIAIRAWNLLATGSGGIDWSGLPVVAELLGVEDVEGLLTRLEVIRMHKPPEQAKQD